MTKKPTKEELSKEINRALGFTENPIDFTRLRYEDLLKFHERVSKFRNLIVNILADKSEAAIADAITYLAKEKEKEGRLPIGHGQIIKKVVGLIKKD